MSLSEIKTKKIYRTIQDDFGGLFLVPALKIKKFILYASNLL